MGPKPSFREERKILSRDNVTFPLRIRLTNDEETDFNAAPGDRGFLFALSGPSASLSLLFLIFALEIA
jgi:hypothetical protein